MSKLNRERDNLHRRRLREQGLRPIQLWVPDLRQPDLRDQAHAQSALVASSAHSDQDQAFIDSVGRHGGGFRQVQGRVRSSQRMQLINVY